MQYWPVVSALFAFAAGAYAWAWSLYRVMAETLQSQGKRLDELWVRVTNHQAHELDEIRRRVSELERRPK